MAGTARVKYFKYLLGKLEQSYRIRGGSHESPYSVLEFSNPGDDVRGVPPGWYYVTDGVSDHSQLSRPADDRDEGERVEIMLYCGTRNQLAAALLEKIANGPADEALHLTHGVILPLDRVEKFGWVGCALFAVGDSCGNIAKPVASDGTPIELLRLFPLLPDEFEYGQALGGRKLEVLLVSRGASARFDRRRNRAVTQRDLARINATRNGALAADLTRPASPSSAGERESTTPRARISSSSDGGSTPPARAVSPAPARAAASVPASKGKDWMGQFYEDLKKTSTRRHESESASSEVARPSTPAPADDSWKPTSGETARLAEARREAMQRVERLQQEAELALEIARRTAASAELIEQSLAEARHALVELETRTGVLEPSGDDSSSLSL